jgi:DNA-binding response OmpR family regulator
MLPGESVEAPAENAERWIRVYEELIEIHRAAIGRLESNGAAGEDVAAGLARNVERFEKRLEFWRARHRTVVGLDLDRRSRRVSTGGQSESLTSREAQLLEFLLAHPGRWYTTERLAGLGWNDPDLSGAQVRNYVVRLRRKLAAIAAPVDVRFQRGFGYSLIERES